jgi:hypothetical protein
LDAFINPGEENMSNPEYRLLPDSARAGASVQSPPASPSLLTDIRIDFGPQDLLGRFFLLADYALRESGVTLGFGTFVDLVETNRANSDTWRPLLPTFDPQNGLLDANWAYTLIGRNALGQIVTAQAARIFDWAATDFREEATTLRLFYDNPRQKAHRDEQCIVTAPSADQIRGMTAFSGGAWWHASVRGRLLGAVLSRVSRAYAYTRWHTGFTAAVMANGLIDKGFAQQNGYQHAEKGFVHRNVERGNFDGGLVWITGDEIIDDLVSFTADLENKLTAMGRLRRA